MKAGIYFHIPYCVRKCEYCDFYSVSSVTDQSMYFEAVKQEMKGYLGKQIPVDSVFIGGGTPSVADAGEIVGLLDEVRKVFSLSSDTEITIELNPRTFNKEKLLMYREAGINRISMGLQSANDEELKKLGRIHTAQEFLASYRLLLETGFSNINTDIMYGLPDSDEKKLEETLSFLLKLDCTHISAYALTLAEDSSLYQKGYTFPDDDEVFRQYQLIYETLSQYRHYEISNFVKQGKEPCRHNLKYWKREPYLGFGAAAHSFYQEKRWSNPADIQAYITAVKSGKAPWDLENISQSEALFEQLMLSFRLDEGIVVSDFPDGYFTPYQKRLEQYLSMGYLIKTERGYRLSEDGFFVSNSIISSFLSEN